MPERAHNSASLRKHSQLAKTSAICKLQLAKASGKCVQGECLRNLPKPAPFLATSGKCLSGSHHSASKPSPFCKPCLSPFRLLAQAFGTHQTQPFVQTLGQGSKCASVTLALAKGKRQPFCYASASLTPRCPACDLSQTHGVANCPR